VTFSSEGPISSGQPVSADKPLGDTRENPQAGAAPEGRIAAIDYGTVRIGVALSNKSRTFSSPHEIYTRRTRDLDAEYFRRLAKDEDVVRFVVGLPVHGHGAESKKSIEARAFGKWLGELTGLPVDYFDERYTTAFARQLLQEAGLTKKRRKERLDKLAAQILLTAYLESPTRGAAEPGSLAD
jgi:putative Holliday junction resolvase